AARFAVEIDERDEPPRLTADDRERERQPEPAGADHRLRVATDGDPHRKRILEGARVYRKTCYRSAMRSAPGDALGFADLEEQLELLLEEVVVVGEVIPEQGKGLGERAAAGHDLGAAVGDEIQRGEILKDPHRIVGADHAYGARETDALRSRSRGGEYDRGCRHDEFAPVMLPDAVDIETDLVGELDLVEESLDPLVGADRVSGLGIGCCLSEA